MWLYPWTVGGWAGAPICCPMTVPTISLDLPTSLARYPSFPLKSLSPTGAECIWERNGASHKPLTHSPEGGRGRRALVSQYGFPSWESLGNSLELPEPICWLTWRWWRCLPWSLWESIEVTKHWVLEWVSHWVPRFQGLLYKHILSNSHNWESRNYCFTAGKIQGRNDEVGSPKSHSGEVPESRWIHTPQSSSKTWDVLSIYLGTWSPQPEAETQRFPRSPSCL